VSDSAGVTPLLACTAVLSINTRVCCPDSCFVFNCVCLPRNCTSNFWWLCFHFGSKSFSSFARRFQRGSAAFVTSVSNLFSHFLSGIGPLEHLFLSVLSSLVTVQNHRMVGVGRAPLKRAWPHILLTPTLQIFVGISKVPSQNSLLQAEQAQFPQPLLSGEMFQSPQHPPSPPLDSLQ